MIVHCGLLYERRWHLQGSTKGMSPLTNPNTSEKGIPSEKRMHSCDFSANQPLIDWVIICYTKQKGGKKRPQNQKIGCLSYLFSPPLGLSFLDLQDDGIPTINTIK